MESNKRPCKFGDNCHQFKMGKCNFIHAPSTGATGAPGGPGGFGGFGGSSIGGKPPGSFGKPSFGGQKPCGKGTDCQFWKKGNCRFLHDQNPVQGGSQIGQQQPPQQPMQQQYVQQQGGKCKYGNNCNRHKIGKCNLDHTGVVDQTSEYCKFWMKGNCTNPNCKKKHSISNDGSVERIYYDDTFPNHPKSSIGAMTKGSTHYLFPRMGNTIYTLQYQAGSDSLNLNQFSLPNQEIISISKNQGSWIIFGYQSNKFQNIKAFNTNTQQGYIIEKAHQKPITGLTMLSDDLLISSSYDYQNPIKIWSLQNNQFTLNVEATKKVTSEINNPKVSIHFCRTIIFQQSKYLCAGTDDGRILLWKEGMFQAIKIPQLNPPYVNIFDFDIKLLFGGVVGFILAWSADKLQSGIFIANLNNTSQVNPFHQEASLMTKMIVTPGGFLITANLGNQVSFYKLQPKPVKVGSAYFDNQISEILYLEATTPTLISMKSILIMQSFRDTGNKNAENAKGSVSIYMLQ